MSDDKQKVCDLPWCDSPVYARGLCNKHWQQESKYGGIQRRTTKDPNEIICEGEICRVLLTDAKGKFKTSAIIDTEDRERVEKYRWGTIGSGYVRSNKAGYLHDFVLGYAASLKFPVDHINRNQLDCRKANLRIGQQCFNAANSPAPKNNTSGFKGVVWHKAAKKWMARIKVNYKGIYLGLFDDPVEAAIAYNEAAVKHFGEFAWLNPVDEERLRNTG